MNGLNKYISKAILFFSLLISNSVYSETCSIVFERWNKSIKEDLYFKLSPSDTEQRPISWRFRDLKRAKIYFHESESIIVDLEKLMDFSESDNAFLKYKALRNLYNELSSLRLVVYATVEAKTLPNGKNGKTASQIFSEHSRSMRALSGVEIFSDFRGNLRNIEHKMAHIYNKNEPYYRKKTVELYNSIFKDGTLKKVYDPC